MRQDLQVDLCALESSAHCSLFYTHTVDLSFLQACSIEVIVSSFLPGSENIPQKSDTGIHLLLQRRIKVGTLGDDGPSGGRSEARSGRIILGELLCT